MRWHWPRTMTMQVMLVLLVGLLVSHFVSSALRTEGFDDSLVILEEVRVADRIGMIRRVMEDLTAQERVHFAKSLSRETLSVSWNDVSAVHGVASDPELQLLEAIIRMGVRDLPRDALKVSFIDADQAKLPERWTASPDLNSPSSLVSLSNASEIEDVVNNLISGRQFLVSIQLRDRSWINVVAAFAEKLPVLAIRDVVSIGILILTVVGLSLWAVNRLTAPLRVLGSAADQLGKNVHASPIPDHGPTEVRQAANAFNLMQHRIQKHLTDQTEMLAAISHDLRAPLTRLRLRTDLIEDSERRRKSIADLDEMDSMISSILAFLREEAEPESRRKVDLTAMIQKICDDLSDPGFMVNFEQNGYQSYLCRPVSMRRCLGNIIQNAAKYGSPVSIRVDRSDTEIAIIVEDSGPGIPAEQLDKVFKPFYRLDKSRNKTTGGVGLGLTVAKAIAQAHGGDICLANRPQGGLQVILSLPAAPYLAERVAA